MNKAKHIILITIALLITLIIGCGIYVNDYYHADDAALAALESGKGVIVQQDANMIAFQPESSTVGFLFYPGGKVEFMSYAPLMRMLAEQGILCVLIEMPFNLAVLDINAAEGIRAKYPHITKWYIGGHSLGGSMAASYVGNTAEEYAGLVLLAAYSTEDLRETDLGVISIYGTEDNVLNKEKYAEYAPMLPDHSEEIIIEGGCHAYFGSYGLQEGDGTPTITPAEQQQITAQILTDFFL